MKRKSRFGAVSVTLSQLGFVIAFLLLWQIASDHNILNPIYFAKPTDIWGQLREWFSTGEIWSSVAETMEIFFIGYAIGTILGAIVGLLVGTVWWLRQILEPYLAFFNAMPRLVLLPLLIVWFGFGATPKVILVVAVIVVIVVLNISAGVQGVRADLLSNARLLGAGRWHLTRYVYIPSVVIWIMSTARVTVGYAFNAAIAAEFIGASKGLGFLIYEGQTFFNAPQVYAGLTITAVIAFILDIVLSTVQNRSTAWMRT